MMTQIQIIIIGMLMLLSVAHAGYQRGRLDRTIELAEHNAYDVIEIRAFLGLDDEPEEEGQRGE